MEQQNTEEYIKNHICRVQKHLLTFINLLQVRAQNHDKSKLEEPELTWLKEMDKEPRYPYGSKEYIDKMRRWKKFFDHHYKYNSHHPEHYPNGINDMTLVDMIEMLCDWVGYRDIMSISEAIKVVDQQMNRYGFSDDLRDIMKNTLVNYFSVLGGFNPDQSKYNNTPIGLVEGLGEGKDDTLYKEDRKDKHIIDLYV